ncbi:MAG: N-(5'-phosphoribosyl)anthranilate isomerase [Actinomycetota bacterium]|nr:N-(5'-phosphoribosyl)anthranilate isomerase [Actinomycetota bacterium]
MTGHGPGAPLLKVCGATSATDVALLAASGADLVGLWHGVPGGHAELSLADITSPAAAARAAGIEPVLVTFGKDVEVLGTVLRLTGIRWVQLHAYQLPGTVAALHAAMPGELTVMKVLHVRSGTCVERPLVGAYERAGTDLFLLDTLTEDGRVGSTGRQLDAADALAVAELTHRPFLLAGGLSSDNRRDFDAVAAHPRYAGIDVDTAARGTDGRFTRAAVRGIARAWHTARHSRNEVA